MTDFLHVGGTRLEYRWIGPAPDQAPTIVFLHEGLGSVSTWRDVPDALAAATGCGALVYSRAGYGRSDPVPLPRPVRFMHDEAEVLRGVLAEAGVRECILLGHSDGASIALIAAGTAPPIPGLRALVLEAPHTFAEPCGLESIAKIADVYRTTTLRERLARHHRENVDTAFWGWNGVWLHPGFASWNIEDVLPGITVPALVIQGADDEYGSWAHVDSIQRGSRGPVETLLVPRCGHAPHAEHRDTTLEAMTRFIQRYARRHPESSGAPTTVISKEAPA